MTSVSSSLDFSKRGEKAIHPSIRKINIQAQNGSTTATLAQSGVTPVRFNFGSQPFYGGKHSVLKGVLNVPLTTSKANWVHQHPGFLIQNMSLQSQSGQQVFQCSGYNDFLRAIAPAMTSIDDFETQDTNLGDSTEAGSFIKGTGNFQYASNALLSGAQTAHGACAKRPPILANGAFTNASKSYVEQQYMVASGNGDAMSIPFEIPFSDFKCSLLASDKLQYVPRDYMMLLDFCSKDRIGNAITTADDNTIGGAAIASAVTITDLELVLAVESNQDIASAKMEAVRTRGQQILIPWVTAVTNATAASTSSSYSIPLDRTYGKNLQAVVSVLHNTLTTTAVAHDISNIVSDTGYGSKVTSFRTRLDNVNLTENVLNCAKAEDYNYMKPLLEGSMCMDSNIWNYNRAYVDSWKANKCIDWQRDFNNEIEDGLSLEDRSKSWQISNTTPSIALLQTYYVITQREMAVAPDGNIQVM